VSQARPELLKEKIYLSSSIKATAGRVENHSRDAGSV
jgi:hypothetical protein